MLMTMPVRDLQRSDAIDRCRKSLVYLLNDPSLSDRERLDHLKRIRDEIEAFICQFHSGVDDVPASGPQAARRSLRAVE